MREYLNMPVKEFIGKFPRAGKILEERKIGCVLCSVGSCTLKDIVEIHNLTEEDEQRLLTELAGVVSPGKKIEIPRIERKRASGRGEAKRSPPIKKLVDEHVIIKRLLALIPRIVSSLDVKSESGRQLIRDCVNFIRTYADRYHHAKEEDILFKYFDQNLDIVRVMRQDHENARAHVRAVLEALDSKDEHAVAGHLNAYRELLAEHIKKEDEILYPWMDKNLSIKQVGEIFSEFDKADRASDRNLTETWVKFLDEQEKRHSV